jgi:hypothetical protein
MPLKNIDEKMTVHFSQGHFEIIVIKIKIVAIQLFDYETPEDFIYYVLPQSN